MRKLAALITVLALAVVVAFPALLVRRARRELAARARAAAEVKDAPAPFSEDEERGLSAMAALKVPRDLEKYARAAPRPLSATMTAYLDSYRALLAQGDDPPTVPHRDRPLLARSLARTLIAIGHSRALAGDASGAEGRYLDSLRLCRHLVDGGNFISIVVAFHTRATSLRALELLVESGALDPPELIRLKTALSELSPPDGTVAGTVARERRTVLTTLHPDALGPIEVMQAAGAVEFYDACEAAARLSDRGARTIRFRELEADAHRSWNPLVHVVDATRGHEKAMQLESDALAAEKSLLVAIDRAVASKSEKPAN